MSPAPTQYFDSVPALLHRSDSDSSTSSTASARTIGTPTDRIVNRDDGSLGGEKGLTVNVLAESIAELLSQQQSTEFKFIPTRLRTWSDDIITWKMQPLLNGPNGVLQARYTHDEVHKVCTILKEEHSLQIDTKPVHMSQCEDKPNSYRITAPAKCTNSNDNAQKASSLPRNYATLSLWRMPEHAPPRPTPEEDDDDEKMDQHTFTAAVDSKLNGIVDDMDALYFS